MTGVPAHAFVDLAAGLAVAALGLITLPAAGPFRRGTRPPGRLAHALRQRWPQLVRPVGVRGGVRRRASGGTRDRAFGSAGARRRALARRAGFWVAGTVGVALLLGWGLPMVLAVSTLAAVAGWLLPLRGARRTRRRLTRGGLGSPTPGMLDLVAAAVESGLPVERAIRAVLQVYRHGGADAGSGGGSRRSPAIPAGSIAEGGRHAADVQHAADVLAEVAALLELGASPRDAWSPAADDPELSPLAAAAVRSALGGVRIASAAREAAEDLRQRERVAGERAAARAGVSITAPLALCFLPAFLCLGLAPVVIGLVAGLHLW